MRKLFTLSICLAFIVSCSFGQSLSDSEGYIDGEIIVRFESVTDAEKFVEDFQKKENLDISMVVLDELFSKLNAFLLGFDESKIDKYSVRDLLESYKEIQYAQFNFYLQTRADTTPNDPFYDTQWDMEIIRAPEVWALSTGGETASGDEIVIAVIDKGFDLNHEDLKDQIWINRAEIPGNNEDDDQNGRPDDIRGWNFISNSPNHAELNHGTNVMGIVGATGNNGIGMTGVNWNVKIMPVSAGTSAQIAKACNYVGDMREAYAMSNGMKGAFVVATNTSLGFSNDFCDEHPLWRDAMEVLGELGVLSVTATVNEDWDVEVEGDMPTTCETEYMITVTNTTMDDEKYENAGYGSKSIDLGAPGTPTVTTKLFSEYRDDFIGTSSSAPHVAGGVGLLYAMPCPDFSDLAHNDPKAAALLVRDAILEGVDPIPTLNGVTVTGGRLNLYGAMRHLHGYCIARSEEREAGNFDNVYIKKRGLVRVYPNPTQNQVTVDFSTFDFGECEIRVYNSLGQMIYRRFVDSLPFENQSFTITDIEDWAAGAYYISLVTKKEKLGEKFVKGIF